MIDLKSSLQFLKLFTGMGLATLVAGVSAHADGFLCDGLTSGTHIEIYNKLKPAEGTRNANIMVVSNPATTQGDQTIATFAKEQGILIQKGAGFYATVDSRFKTANQIRKPIAGTTLGELETITVIVNFNYRVNTPSHIGDRYSAVATYAKEMGSDITENMVCVRYKKH
jgi:hypothetical protein